ncbi:unnamed protein product, partial [Aureobasidium mustum]
PTSLMDEYFQAGYTYQNQSGGDYIPLLDALKDLLEGKIQAGVAAARVASFVFSKRISFPPTIIFITGAAHIVPEKYKLAELIIELSRLPDACNGSQDFVYQQSNDGQFAARPGEVFTINGQKIWADLPLLTSISVIPFTKGPMAYISDGLAEHLAEQRWLNLNTFAAYLICDSDRSGHSFDYLFHYAFQTLTQALEYDPSAVDGAEALLHLSSACRWVLIAGEKLVKRTVVAPWYAGTGPTWLAQDGTDLIDESRWAAWANRLDELVHSNMIAEEVKTLTRESANKIRKTYLHSTRQVLHKVE